MQRILSIISKLGMGALVAVFLVETFLYVIALTPASKIFPVIEPQLGQPDKDIGYAFTPNTTALWTKENRALVSINSLGLRDNEIAFEKSPHTYRIALTGDSIVEALQVEKKYAFDNLVGKTFKEQGRNIEIMNFAMAGNGPLRQLVRLEKFATPLKPDLIIMLMSSSDFLTGELLDDSGNPGYKIKDNNQVERSYGFKNRFSQRHADTIFGKTFLFLMRHSNIFRTFYFKIKEPKLKILGLNIGRKKSINVEADKCKAKDINKLYEFWVKQPHLTDWRVAQHFFTEVSQYAQTAPIILGMYILTVSEQCVKQKVQRAKIVHSLKQITQKYNINFVDWNDDVLKYLDNDQDIDMLYGFGMACGNGHLNYRGHSIYAQVLYKTISAHMNY